MILNLKVGHNYNLKGIEASVTILSDASKLHNGYPFLGEIRKSRVVNPYAIGFWNEHGAAYNPVSNDELHRVYDIAHPWANWPVDTQVLVYMSGSDVPLRRYFAGIINRKPAVFKSGKTSFTANGDSNNIVVIGERFGSSGSDEFDRIEIYTENPR